MDAFTEANRQLWDEWTRVHEGSDFYALDSFKNGDTLDRPFDAAPGIRVRAYEVDEIGAVRGKDLLHLQCHFGIDTLSWARLGACVTGIDFSERAVALARSLADELRIDATFLVSTVHDLRKNLAGDFDVVYTSRGAITWLGDLTEWAATISHFLRPGGTFYMTEFHPVLQTLDDARDARDLRIVYPYFARPEPMTYAVSGSYADRSAEIDADVEHNWPHHLGEIVTSIPQAGLVIEFLHEFDWVDYQHTPILVQSEDGKWRLPPGIQGELPLMYSLRARKPE